MGATLISLEGLTADRWAKSESSLQQYFVSRRPANWRDYANELLSMARSTAATEIAYLGQGFEGVVYELFRDGKPMWVALRAQDGNAPHPRIDGSLPFYRDQMVEFPGDPHPDGNIEEPLEKIPLNAGDSKRGFAYHYGMRMTLMPKVIPEKLLANDYGQLEEGVTEDDLDLADQLQKEMTCFISRQGFDRLDDQPKNRGFYAARHGKFVPVLFDPGPAALRYPESIAPGSTEDRRRYDYAHACGQERSAWMSPHYWTDVRTEILADGRRLFQGKSTVYAQRMEKLMAKGITAEEIMRQVVQQSNEPSL